MCLSESEYEASASEAIDVCGRGFCRSEVPAFFRDADVFCDIGFVCLSGEREYEANDK